MSGPLPQGLTNLRNLRHLSMGESFLCAPDNDEFRTWVGSLSFFGGEFCRTNHPPEPVGVLAPVTIGVDESSVMVEVSGAFRDPDGDRLTYGARSSAPNVVTAAVSGSTVTLTPVSAGTATVTVTARDPAGLSASQTIAVTVTSSADMTDRAVLETLYAATGGAGWTNSANWKTAEPLGEWHGVRLDATGRVAELQLLGNNLSGAIPAELGSLGNLRVLQLWGNNLSGPIPAGLGSLINLIVLQLGNNSLSGPIPGELGSLSNLQELGLGGNRLSGLIPGELGSLGNLTWLALTGNRLSGPIPSELGSLSNLRDLWLVSNSLSGPIPGELGSLANLETLWLGENNLSGSIPRELGNLANLEDLSLRENNLSGPIPAELASLGNLGWLSLNENNLSGPIPTELASLSRLRDLSLGANNLSGPIPAELASLGNLEELGLGANNLSGLIPRELGNLINLEGLVLHENDLSGPLPSSMTNLRQLESLWIYNNAGLCVPADAAFQAWLATIDDFQGDTCAVNRAPQPVGTIPAQTLREGAGALALNVATYFQDPDGDPLAYTAVTGNGGVVRAAVSGSVVSLTPVSAGTAAVTVTARDPAGLSATQTLAVTVTRPFTDHPIVPGVTPVKAVHFTELRTRIDALRAAVGLGRYPWTDSRLVAGVTPVRGVHMSELRTALAQAYEAAGRTVGFSIEAIQAGRGIRAWHINELRRAVETLER